MASMDTDEERDELTGADELIPSESMDDEPTYRDRAAAKLDQIAHETQQALAEHGVGVDLGIFFVIPNNGHSVLMFGTPADPSDDLWSEVCEIVSAIVRNLVGLERTRCRSLLCATTGSSSIS
jgi:hypothetical protein